MDTRTPMLPIATTRRFIAHVLDAEAGGRSPARRAGARGLATARARMVTLLWSERAEAERWGNLIAEHPRTQALSLADLSTRCCRSSPPSAVSSAWIGGRGRQIGNRAC